MAKNRMMYAAALLGACLFYSFYFYWFSWYLLLLVLAMPLFSLLCSLPGMLTMQVKVQVPAAVNRGQRANMVFTAKAAAPVALCRAEVHSRSPFSGEQRTDRLFLQRGTTPLLLPVGHCGVLHYTVDQVRVYDFLGLFCRKVRAAQSGEVVVHPVPAAPEALPPISLSQPLGYRKSAIGTNEAYELREYVPGDDLRTVHWKLTAKQDELIVREPMEEEQAPMVLTFDPGHRADTADWTLERVLWISRWLLRQEKSHELHWLEGEGRLHHHALIQKEEDMFPVMEQLVRALPGVYSAAGQIARASWRCHVAPKEARR
ncbi:MAG: DUF58 domain-containing protein [Clostridia bacterium]|nr:DUF58 domain-containing protein [Clostridia bacterium]